MKKLMLIAVMLLLLIPQSVLAAPPNISGTGTPEDPYIIYTAIGLNQVRNDLSAHYKLGADIDLSGYPNWEPIGNFDARFLGSFNGNGHTITNLTINRPTEDLIGFFGNVNTSASITELVLLDIYVEGLNNVGGLVGFNFGSIRDSYTTGYVKANNTGFVTGGLVGFNAGTIERSFSNSNVEGSNEVGGFVGFNDGSISNSYAIGSVTGNDAVGGFIGSNASTIEESYATGEILALGIPGGFAGINGGGTIVNSYYAESTGQTDTGKGTRLTDAQMKQGASFVGWDFTNIWTIDEGISYPTLISLSATSATTIDLVSGLNKLNNNVFIISNHTVKDFDVTNSLPYGYATLTTQQ